jgi:hypothetical protein
MRSPQNGAPMLGLTIAVLPVTAYSLARVANARSIMHGVQFEGPVVTCFVHA